MSTITTINNLDTGLVARTSINTNFTNLNTDKAEKSGGVFTGDITVPDEVYGVGWNGSLEVPTKNAIYDKIETLGGGGDMVLASTQTVSGLKTFLAGMFGLRNVANTFTGFFTNTNTANRTYTLQDSDDTLVGRATTDTLSNKTLVAPTLGTPASGTLTNCTGLPIAGLVASTSTAIGVGTIELGNASDTTISRSSAGVIAVEGIVIPSISSTNTLTNKTLTSPTLTTPVLGTPSSGNLTSCTADGTDEVGFRNIPQNSKSAAYTTVLADKGKHIYHPVGDANARTFTIDSNANVAYPIGTAITFINRTSQVVTIAITSDTMTLAGTVTTGSRSLAQNGIATAIKDTTTGWLISGTGLT